LLSDTLFKGIDMAHFAKVNNGIVEQVSVAEQGFIDKHTTGTWLQTSYNTQGGVHSNGEIPLRKNYAGVGYTYDSVRDAFIEPQPYPSWVLDEATCRYEAPVPYPTDGLVYDWNEDTTNWMEIE